MRDAQSVHPIRLADYQAPAWRVDTVDLAFDLDIHQTDVRTRMTVRRNAEDDTPLVLSGEKLELLEVHLDGRQLESSDYQTDAHALTVPAAKDGSTVETLVRIRPSENTALEGLYLSGSEEDGFLLTQCEAQGFRRITYFPDRPDVQARYTLTLRADKERFPVLLGGGNPDGSGDLDDGRHWARFVDPHPKPSYLFALVAGHLEKISRDYTTADGRAVTLNLWAENGAIEHCDYAMNALERAMRWDEQTYGRNYDLDVFHVVATYDFNMGAMENKGLNIFNAKYLLADPETTTDAEYRGVESVVAHEYFHNWSGNRITCRDWFQLSLKEGLTVFREHNFSADMNSRPLKRIEDVSMLRRVQFSEDAGPLAHPVRPEQYREINNFYTATVYEKGCELVRMIAGRLGTEGFRCGMDRYFERHDGDAATIEDFLTALGEANDLDLSPYLAWYGQAGTPRLRSEGHYDAANRRYTLTLSQRTPATPGQDHKQPLPIPVRLALFSRDGHMQQLRLEGETEAQGRERVIELTEAQQSFVFEDLDVAPIASLLRNFSAPVLLEQAAQPQDLEVLLRHDIDGYNRWDAGQQLAAAAFDALHAGEDEPPAAVAWARVLSELFAERQLDRALLAELMTPPQESELSERHAEIDPDKVHMARRDLEQRLATRIGAEALIARYNELHAYRAGALDADAQARRRLKSRVLELLSLIDADMAAKLAERQYADATDMTDRLAATRCLLNHGGPAAERALEDFRRRFADRPLALDKWFSVQAQKADASTLDRVRELTGDDAFTLRNPNRLRALLGAFTRSNPVGFHRADGAGYHFLAEQLTAVDALNPQVAARLATAFNGWRRLEPGRRKAAHQVLAGLANADLSTDLGDIVDRALQD